MKRYRKLKDGEGIEIPYKNGAIIDLACCDCGLVHRFAIVVEGNKLGIACKRRVRETAERRKNKRLPMRGRK